MDVRRISVLLAFALLIWSGRSFSMPPVDVIEVNVNTPPAASRGPAQPSAGLPPLATQVSPEKPNQLNEALLPG